MSMRAELKLDYNSIPIYIGKELHDEETGRCLRITKILSVEVKGAITIVEYQYEYVSCF